MVLTGLIFFANDLSAKRFTIDPDHGSIKFSVKHLALSPVVGGFTKYSGFIDVDLKKRMVRKAFIKIDVDSIKTDNDDRDAHLKSKDFFHVRNDVYDIIPANRHMEFTANSFSLKNTLKLRGMLRILKKKREVDLAVKIKNMNKGGHLWKIGITANGMIDRKNYGLTWQKPTSGLKEKIAGKFVGDEVKLIVSLTFQDDKKQTN